MLSLIHPLQFLSSCIVRRIIGYCDQKDHHHAQEQSTVTVCQTTEGKACCVWRQWRSYLLETWT